MKEKENEYVKRSQKDYSMSFIVKAVRKQMPRIGFRKLYYMLYEPLKENQN